MLRFALVLATAFLLLAPMDGAPVPPPPKELTPAMMCGEWRFGWGSYEDGTTHLYPDGSFVSWLYPDATAYYCGSWWCDGGDVVLRERASFSTVWTDYRYQMNPKTYPNLVGLSNGGTRVSLTGRR